MICHPEYMDGSISGAKVEDVPYSGAPSLDGVSISDNIYISVLLINTFCILGIINPQCYLGESSYTDQMRSRPLTCIFHGPAVFDEGDAAIIERILAPDRLIVAGVMGRTAAAESGLAIIPADLPPSFVINKMTGDSILVNRGKTPESGRWFGEIVASRIIGGRGLVHIECSDQTCYLWNEGDRILAEYVADQIGYTITEVTSSCRNTAEIRTIHGCLPGEPVCVEGITIGYATAGEVIISRNNGTLIPISGIRIKPHGLEKLTAIGCPPLDRAWCKSGQIRSNLPHTGARQAPGCGRVAVIDHAALDIYRIITPDLAGIITIGDDTTAVCGHIGAVHGVPVFGITDGDADGIVPETYAPGSVVTHVIVGSDDEIGREIAAVIPPGTEIYWDRLVADLLSGFSGTIRIVRDLR